MGGSLGFDAEEETVEMGCEAEDEAAVPPKAERNENFDARL